MIAPDPNVVENYETIMATKEVRLRNVITRPAGWFSRGVGPLGVGLIQAPAAT